MTFLPQGYKTPEPKGGNYFKPKKGESRVRILQAPILGFEAWTPPTSDKPHGTPVRRKLDDFSGVVLDPKKKPKHFWAMPVWEYGSLSVKVWQVTQNTIQTAIEALSYTKEWGDPRRYDLIIKRDGETMQDTVYTVMPCPPSRLSEEAREAFKDHLARGFDISRLYNNGDPFSPGEATTATTKPTLSPSIRTPNPRPCRRRMRKGCRSDDDAHAGSTRQAAPQSVGPRNPPARRTGRAGRGRAPGGRALRGHAGRGP